jgi:hypothetical protein
MKTVKLYGMVMVMWMFASVEHLLANGADVVHPEFLNELKVGVPNPPFNQASSMTIFGGNIDTIATAPSGTTSNGAPVLLVESSFGQAFATDVPYPNFAVASIVSAQAMMYAAPNWTRAEAASSDRVFRYKVLLFGTNSGGVSIDPSQLASYFGDAERQKFGDAVKLMRDALKYAPYDRTLRNTLLDAYYDLAVAEVQFAKVLRAEMAEYRLGFRPVPPGAFVIDQEITATTNLLRLYELALSRYGELLTDRMGVNVSEHDPAVTNDLPLGAYILRQEQPVRSQFAAQFYDSDGVLKTVPYYDPDLGQTTTNTAPRVLFAGYKDYVNLVALLREYTVNAADLARLYGMRGGNDVQAAQNLISKVQGQAQVQMLILKGLFPDYTPAPGDASGVLAAIHGLGVGLAELDNVSAFLAGRKNLLGFDPNFLVLIKEAPEGQTSRFDSYDALMYWIGGRGTPSPFTPLGYAGITFDSARASYDTYKGNADQVWDQLDQITDTYSDRYFEITGWDSADSTTNHLVGARDGSELWQAHRNVELGTTRVANITNQMNNLDEIVAQANEVVTLATSKSNRLESARNNYFGSTSNTWDNLMGLEASAAVAQVAFDTTVGICSVDGISTVASFGGDIAGIAVMGTFNALVQGATASARVASEQSLENAAADYEVAQMEIDIPAELAQAKIEYQEVLRQQKALQLELEDARAMQAQEVARRQALIRELERIKQQAQESDANLADRYYADPIHSLRAQNDMILADEAFGEAQRWVFFTLRALEFKWNKNFVISWVNKDWELSSLFKLRNYAELEQIVGAMEEFNRINLLGFNREAFVDVISLRDDVMAPPDGGTNGLWLDVVTRQRVTATELLRRKLQRSLDGEGNLVITLDTFALKKDTGFLFLGPRYRTNGTVLSAGKYLDKIDWVKFNIVGSHATATRDANLSYGGTCYIRTRVPPCGDLTNPFTLPGEYRPFPFFYFRTLDNGVTWQTRTTQDDTVKVAFTQTPGEPANPSLENHFLKERSVAATAWVLTLPAGTFNINQINDIEIWVRHLFVTRETPDCD